MTLTADRIKECRKSLPMTMDALASKLGVKQRTIVNWENGTTTPSVSKINKIAEILNVDPGYLLGTQKDKRIIPLSNFLEELEQERFIKFFNELSKNFSENDYNNLIDIMSSYSLLDNEDKDFFTKIIALKSGLIDKKYEARDGKIILDDKEKYSL